MIDALARRFRSTLAVIAMLFALAISFAVPGAVSAEPTSVPESGVDRVGGYVYDVAILRTTGVLKTAIGAAFLIPAYPISLASEQNASIVERLVTEPAKDTFTRPIGDF
jgi:hypothetical protein